MSGVRRSEQGTQRDHGAPSGSKARELKAERECPRPVRAPLALRAFALAPLCLALLAPSAALAGVNRWTVMGKVGGGSLRVLSLSPEFASDRLGYAMSSVTTVTQGGEITLENLYRSSDGGTTWSVVRSSSGATLTSHDVQISATYAQDRTIVSTGWRSVDGGLTWSRVATLPKMAHIRLSPAFASDHTVLGWGASGEFGPDAIFRSRDGGNTWARVFTGARMPLDEHESIWHVAISPGFATDRTILAAGTFVDPKDTGRFLASTDGGSTWKRRDGLGRLAEPYALAFSPAFATDRTMFGLWAPSVFARSTDRGNTWVRPASADFSHARGLQISPGGLFVSPDYVRDRTLFALLPGVPGGDPTLFRSRDRGDRWFPVGRGLPPPSVLAISPDYATSHLVFAGGDSASYDASETRVFACTFSDDATPPAPPRSFKAKLVKAPGGPWTGRDVLLSWDEASNPDNVATLVLRSVRRYARGPHDRIGQAVIFQEDATSCPQYDSHPLDSRGWSPLLANGTRYYYTAFVNDTSGNWSRPATAAITTLKAFPKPIVVSPRAPRRRQWFKVTGTLQPAHPDATTYDESDEEVPLYADVRLAFQRRVGKSWVGGARASLLVRPRRVSWSSKPLRFARKGSWRVRAYHEDGGEFSLHPRCWSRWTYFKVL